MNNILKQLNIEKPKTIELNSITEMDCLLGMKSLESNSIDMICTDPPYFLDMMGNDWDKKKLDDRLTSSVIHKLPIGMKFDKTQTKKFREFYDKVCAELFRVLKPGGIFISFSNPRLYHAMATSIDDAGFEIRDMIGWVYLQGQVKAFSHNHVIENDSKFTDEEKEHLKELMKDTKSIQLRPAIEPICLAMKPIEGRYVDNYAKYQTGLMHLNDETKVGIEPKFSPANIVLTEEIKENLEQLNKVFLVQKPKVEERGEFNTHISVKPLSLISHFIKLFTNKNSTILDPFMGSGTTAVACKMNERNYIGFEINPEYVEICKKRLLLG